MSSKKHKHNTTKSSSTELLICNSKECVDDQDKDSLTCAKCKRSIHYRCTMLPAYQIQMFVNLKSHRFRCQNCVDVSPEILELVPNRPKSPSPMKTNKEIERLRREVEECTALIKQFEAKEKEFQAKFQMQKNEFESLQSKLQTTPGLHTIEYVEEKFEKKLEDLKSSIKEMICERKEESYATIASSKSVNNAESFKRVLVEAKKEEANEMKDKERRSRNVIIHGVPEQSTNEDRNFVDSFVKEIRISVNIKRLARIGVADNNKTRPLLVGLNDAEEKRKIIGNLSVLRGNQTYKSISVTEDLTPQERKQFRELSQEAKLRNSSLKEVDAVWRVRGNSKNGFFLKKVRKITNQNQISHQ